MRFRRLKLSGFKSFVEPAELRIEPGLTGVVGPNGCGKSNLLEAIRWVMGEASAKSLRGGGMDDVIFAGTATRAARAFAEVSLLVEQPEPDGDGIVRAREREVTRRIERGAGSAYRLDGRDVRARDIALLFADAATGAHSPALVSQGRIGAVIAARPVERRQMLEEAAGIAGLHARRKDAEARLRAAEANLQRLDELMAEAETRAHALRRQARGAERYRLLTERIRLAEARTLFARWAGADRAARAAAAEAAAAAADVARLQDAMERAQAAQAAAAALVHQRRDADSAVRSEGQDAAHRLATARARRETLVRRLGELDQLYVALAAEIAREEALRDDAERAGQALAAEMTALAARIADREGQAEALTRALGEAEAGALARETALAELIARQAAMQAERRVAEAAAHAAATQVERLAAEGARLAAQRRSLDDGDAAQTERTAALAARAEAGKAATEAQARIDRAEAARADAAAARDAAESALAAARAALASADSEAAALDRALAHGRSGAPGAALRARPGFERALAAALADDFDAPVATHGPRRWEGAGDGAGDPPLAAGLEPLLAKVEAPRELHRRLAQIGVAARDEGQILLPGQRLVTPDGRCRRWDGFVSEGAGAAAAERLVRANRRDELAHARPSLLDALAGAEAARAAAEQALGAEATAGEAARRARDEAERAAREAARRADTAAARLERAEAQARHLDERAGDLAPVVEAARAAHDDARAALAALPDPAGLGQSLDEARTAAARAGDALAQRRAEAASAARDLALAREREAAAQREAAQWRKRGADALARLAETAERAAAQGAERAALKDQPAALAQAIADEEQALAGHERRRSAAAAALAEAQAALDGLATALAQAGEAFARARETRAAALARVEAHEARRSELAGQCGEAFECPPPLLPDRIGFDAREMLPPETEKAALDRLLLERERLGPVNLVAEQELAALESSALGKARERDELGQAIHRLRGSIGSLNREGRVRLLDAFRQVDGHFRSLFATLFGGGEARLELIESDDPLEAGLEIMAQPPGKRLTALTLLSGGEQALTAVALVFALFLTNPAPICVLDEVDAPLDDANVERFCDLLERMARDTDTRYLIVTHNAVTMARMDRLYGVTMVEQGVSRLVSVDLGGAERLLAAE